MTWEIYPLNTGYEVSESGVVRKGKRVIKIGLGGGKKGKEYQTVWIGGKKEYLHRVVCMAFHGEPVGDRNEVGHRDGDRLNNRANNLRWVTSKENGQDKVLHGTTAKGQSNGWAKLSEADVIAIRCDAGLQADIARRYNTSQSNVSDIKLRKRWAHVS